jgi:opacity protein-like surface antigen
VLKAFVTTSIDEEIYQTECQKFAYRSYHMNKSLLAVGLSIICAACYAETQSNKSQWFVRTNALLVSPSEDGYSNAGGIGASLGAMFGAGLQHEFNVEFGYTNWKMDDYIGNVRVKATEHHLPVLASYRYYFNADGAPVRPYVSPGFGYQFTKVDAEAVGYGSESASDGSFCYTGAIGALIRLTDKIDFDLGYRYLHADGMSGDVQGVPYETDAFAAHIGYLGVSFKF